jgi:hypothetical protein
MAGSPAPGCPIASQAWRLEARAKFVMPGLVPGIHVLLLLRKKDVDGRDEPGHDEKASRIQAVREGLKMRDAFSVILSA